MPPKLFLEIAGLLGLPLDTVTFDRIAENIKKYVGFERVARAICSSSDPAKSIERRGYGATLDQAEVAPDSKPLLKISASSKT